jgi:hypothetical protein
MRNIHLKSGLTHVILVKALALSGIHAIMYVDLGSSPE